MTRKRIAFYLRHHGNLHYFAALKPYLDHFLARHECQIVVHEPGFDREYAGYHHLFASGAPRRLRPRADADASSRPRNQNPLPCLQIFHGISDKPFTYERDFSDYRLCLCAGQRQVDRLMRNERNRAMRFAVIGYPKFDHVASKARDPESRDTVKQLPGFRLSPE
ncbi:MAG: hypothetical protein ACREV9_18340 [Burkholderiales bacterium]